VEDAEYGALVGEGRVAGLGWAIFCALLFAAGAVLAWAGMSYAQLTHPASKVGGFLLMVVAIVLLIAQRMMRVRVFERGVEVRDLVSRDRVAFTQLIAIRVEGRYTRLVDQQLRVVSIHKDLKLDAAAQRRLDQEAGRLGGGP